MEEKLQSKVAELNQWNNGIRIPMPEGYTVVREGAKITEGYYLTLRLRKGLLYQLINEYKDGQWQGNPGDGSVLVMYKDVPQRFYEILQEITEIQAEAAKEESRL